jgi:hypothetical protein
MDTAGLYIITLVCMISGMPINNSEMGGPVVALC